MSPLRAKPKSTAGDDDLRWFTDEVHSCDASLKAYLRGAFPSVRDVDDVVQECYLRVWKSRAVAPIRSAKAFLFTVARRLALDLVRHHRRSPIVAARDAAELFVFDPAPDGSAVTSRAEDIGLLVDAIESLPARCREIFVLCHVEGLAQREVATRLRVSESTVAVQSARGLQRCAEFVRRRLNRP